MCFSSLEASLEEKETGGIAVALRYMNSRPDSHCFFVLHSSTCTYQMNMRGLGQVGGCSCSWRWSDLAQGTHAPPISCCLDVGSSSSYISSEQDHFFQDAPMEGCPRSPGSGVSTWTGAERINRNRELTTVQ